MSKSETVIHLSPASFDERERTLVEAGPLRANVFRYPTGVAAVRLRSDVGSVVVLPFQGQHVWSAEMLGRDLKMRTMVEMPRPTTDFLATFGGFLQHCGLSGVGAPGPGDSHPLHGELPNAPLDAAWLTLGEDARGTYLGIGGRVRLTRAFGYDHVAEPSLRLYAGSSVFWVRMAVTNLKQSPLELMYLMHINFKPIDRARLVYSARATPEHVRVRTSIPSHIKPGPGYAEFLETLKHHPTKHHLLEPGLPFDPEVVFAIDYLADDKGWAHSLLVHPEGGADYVTHRPHELPRFARWICRTADQDALGFEPGTSGVEGYSVEKARGAYKTLAAGEAFQCEVGIGALAEAEAARVREKITRIVGAEHA
jgi:hypothetical protein